MTDPHTTAIAAALQQVLDLAPTENYASASLHYEMPNGRLRTISLSTVSGDVVDWEEDDE